MGDLSGVYIITSKICSLKAIMMDSSEWWCNGTFNWKCYLRFLSVSFLTISDLLGTSEIIQFLRTRCVFGLLFHVENYISHIGYLRFKFSELWIDGNSWSVWYAGAFLFCVCICCTCMKNCVYEREGEYGMCTYTPYNDCVVGAMVTHQMGSVMGAAVLHLLCETLLSPLLSSPLLIF